jgi:hypothetical protein
VEVPVTEWSKYAEAGKGAVQRSTDIRFYLVTDEEVMTQKLLDAQNHHNEKNCTCENPEGFTLAVENGRAIVTHTKCGKWPWFMDDDWDDVIFMEAIPVKVEQATGCSFPPHDRIGCDCGVAVDLIPERETSAE